MAVSCIVDSCLLVPPTRPTALPYLFDPALPSSTLGKSTTLPIYLNDIISNPNQPWHHGITPFTPFFLGGGEYLVWIDHIVQASPGFSYINVVSKAANSLIRKTHSKILHPLFWSLSTMPHPSKLSDNCHQHPFPFHRLPQLSNQWTHMNVFISLKTPMTSAKF